MTPELGEVVCLLYPTRTARALSEVMGLTERSIHHYARRRGIRKLVSGNAKPIGYKREHRGYVHQKIDEDTEGPSRFAFAHVVAWEEHFGRKKPKGHVIVILDGDKKNFAPTNLYCLPKSELLGWMRFVSAPVEVHVDRLWRKVMTLDTSEKVKRMLLGVLEQVSDPNKTPDLMRQRAVCETVNTLVGLLRAEIAYIDAVEGDGRIPFLEPIREEVAKQREAAKRRRGLLGGPAADHPWRGLGSNGS